MGHHHLPIPAALSALLLLAGASPALAEGQGALPDVLIQAEQKKPVSREKPPLALEVKEEAPFEALLDTEQELRLRLPAEMAKSTHFVTGLSASPHVAVPSSNRIVLAWKGEPARVFRPAEELAKVYKEKEVKAAGQKAAWQLVVVDSAGRPFRKYGGQGLPPERLEFDGKSDEGRWLGVGQAYTAVIDYKDPAGRPHTAMERPFALLGLSVQSGAGYVISLAPRALLDPEKGGLSDRGASLLREAAVLIERYHPGLSVEVAARLSSTDPAAAKSAAEACAGELAKRLRLPPGTLSAKAETGTPDLESRVDLSVLNR